MAYARRYREDLTYAEWHRHRLPELYERDGHRLDVCDRDWTEFCTACRAPIAVVEEVVDHGQNPNEKATTVTRKLAGRAHVNAYYLVVHIDRPGDVQREIEELGRRLGELEQKSTITGFHGRRLVAGRRTPLVRFTPDEWAQEIRLWHRGHHVQCALAQRRRELLPIDAERIWAFKRRSRLYLPADEQLPLMNEGEAR